MVKDYKITARGKFVTPTVLTDATDALLGPLDTLIAALNVASSALEVAQMFLLDLSDPNKSLFLQLLQELENNLTALKEAGIYSILIPPPINAVKQLATDIETRADRVSEEMYKVGNEQASRMAVFNSIIDFSDPYQFVPGGLYRVNSLLSGAFFDSEDKNRPVFPKTGSQMGGAIFMVDAPAGQFVDLFSAFLFLLGSVVDFIASFPIDALTPPDDFRVESKPGKVVITFRDPTAVFPPRRYQILRSEKRTGDQVYETEFVANEPRIIEKKDSKGSFIYQWTLIEEIDVLSVFAVDDIAKRLVSDAFTVEDKTGDVGKTYYYTIRKSFHNRQSGLVQTDDRATGAVAPAQPGINLEANIVLAADLTASNTFGDEVIELDQPFADKDFNAEDLNFEIKRRELLDTVKVKGSGLTILPEVGGKIKIDNEIIYYKRKTNVDTINDTATLEDAFRGREGTFSKKHSTGTPVEVLGQYKFSRNPTEPNFFPPIKLTSFFPEIGAVVDLLINVLRSIAKGFTNATENLAQYIQAIQNRIDELIRDLQRIRDILASLDDNLLAITVTAIILPTKTQGTEALVERINAAFATSGDVNEDGSPKSTHNVPPTSPKNIATAFGIFWGGPQSTAIENIVSQIFKE